MRRVWLAFLVLITVPAAIFLTQDGYFASSDGMIHLYRLFELDRALHAGIFYPRWFPLSGYGYGLPVLNYYPPLTYYLGELFHLAGAGYIASIKLLIALGFVVAAFSMFLFACDLLGDAPAFVAGVAYAYLPYLLSDAYVRGNLPEFLAMSILPLALRAFRRLFIPGAIETLAPPARAGVAATKAQSRPLSAANPRLVGVGRPFDFAQGRLGDVVGAVFSRHIVFAALTFAAVILLHHLTAMLFAALLLAYVLFLFAMQRDWTRLLASGAAAVLALALSAFYWLPSLGELDLVYVGPASVARFLVNRLVELGDFFAPSLAYVYLPQSEALKHAAGFPQTVIALAVGVVLLLVILSTFATLSVNSAKNLHIIGETLRFAQGDNVVHALFFFLVVVVSIFMTFTFSAPLWYTIPPLRFMQFPWRFQILAGIGIAFLLGVCAKWIADAVSRFKASAAVSALASIVLVGLGIANLPVRAFSLSDADVNLLRSGDPGYVVAQMGWGWTREFVPATAQDFESIYTPFVKLSVPLPDHARPLPTIQIQDDGLLSTALHVLTAQPIDISLHTFFFPGWQAYIDGAPARTFPRGSLGLASVTVSPGNHAVQFKFEDTPLRVAANWISILTVAAGLAWLIIAHRRAAAALIGALVLVGALLLWHTRAADAASLGRTSAPTVSLSANLDDRVMLVGYSIDRAQYHAGDPIDVTLYWFALTEMDKDYQVTVHLVGSGNETLAQQDGVPNQGLTPTTRWLPGEIVVDRHVLALAAIAPGDYRLVAAMYLPLDNGYANLGDQVELGRVQITK